MTPRLVLLTGPAAEEVAEALRFKCDNCGSPADCMCSLELTRGASVPFEVRDYRNAGVLLRGAIEWALDNPHDGSGVVRNGRVLSLPQAIQDNLERSIRSLPGGEAWLVGLVLPEFGLCMSNGHGYPLGQPKWGCARCREVNSLPARLAILAPDPPPLLVDRLRAWGGEVWICIYEVEATDGKPCCIYNAAWPDEPRDADTWSEAVRAALGEA